MTLQAAKVESLEMKAREQESVISALTDSKAELQDVLERLQVPCHGYFGHLI